MCKKKKYANFKFLVFMTSYIQDKVGFTFDILQYLKLFEFIYSYIINLTVFNFTITFES